MSAVQEQWQPKVIDIGFPIHRKGSQKTFHVNDFNKRSFPVLAVTRSKTTPCFTLSDSSNKVKSCLQINMPKPKEVNEEKLSHRCQSSPAVDARGSSVNVQKTTELNGQEIKRTCVSSYPVWPVTDPTTVRKVSEDTAASQTLPRPRLSAKLAASRHRRKSSLGSVSFWDSGPPNAQKNSKLERPSTHKIKALSKQPSRSNTPVSEYDPDQLNIGQVVQFLDSRNQSYPKFRNHPFEYPGSRSRPRPATVANTKEKYERGLLMSRNSPDYSPRRRRSPIAARRYLKSAKCESNSRDLSVSSLGMSDNRRLAARDYKQLKRMDTLASLAARYNSVPATPKNQRLKDKGEKLNEEQSLKTRSETVTISPQEYFGRLKYESATFHSFPTNKVEAVEKSESQTCERKETASPFQTKIVLSHTETKWDKPKTRDDERNGSVFNATNAIRLPSVFDNIDCESEDLKTDNTSVSIHLETLTVSEASDKEQGQMFLVGNQSKNNYRPTPRENKHGRHLSAVLSREKSLEGQTCSKCLDVKTRTEWWITPLEDPKSKVIELKLTHGSPSMNT